MLKQDHRKESKNVVLLVAYHIGWELFSTWMAQGDGSRFEFPRPATSSPQPQAAPGEDIPFRFPDQRNILLGRLRRRTPLAWTVMGGHHF